MKRTGLLVLALSFATQASFAYEVNRQDVNQAQAQGEQLSYAEYVALKGEVVLADAARSALILAQMPMNLAGVEHRTGPVTVVLGASQTAAAAVAAVYSARKMNTVRLGKVDAELTKHIQERNLQRKMLKGAKKEAVALRATEESAARANAIPVFKASEKLADLEAKIATAEAKLAEANAGVATIVKDTRYYKRLGRPTRLFLGVALPAVAVTAGVSSLLAVTFPESGDQMINNLSKFIDESNATLDAQ